MYLDLLPTERAAMRGRLLEGLAQFTLGGMPAVAADGPACGNRPTARTQKGAD